MEIDKTYHRHFANSWYTFTPRAIFTMADGRQGIAGDCQEMMYEGILFANAYNATTGLIRSFVPEDECEHCN